MASKFQLSKAAHIIHNEGVIAYPTESVFGLGCDPLSEHAVNRILQLKQRHVNKGLIIIADNINQLIPYINISASEKIKIEKFKTPMTWLVNKSKLTPPWISGKHNKVAIRVCQHPLVKHLCKLLNSPIVSTSANPAGIKPATNILQARNYFLDGIDLYLNDNTGTLARPTPITDLSNNALIRDS